MALAEKALQGPDGDGLIDVPSAAGRLAGGIAYPATGGGEGVGLPRHDITLRIVPVGYGVHIASGIRTNRAGILTADHTLVVAGINDLNAVLLIAHGRLRPAQS